MHQLTELPNSYFVEIGGLARKLNAALGRYWPISFLADGPSPGNEVTNLRMLVGLWANAQARPFPSVW